jgi:hypothetical protein
MALIITVLMAIFLNATILIGTHNGASFGDLPISSIALAETTAAVYVNPPSNTYSLDEVFTIEVVVANVTNLYGVDIRFAWNPTILEYVSHTAKIPVEDFPGGILHEPGISIKNQVNATAGTYWLAYACMDPAPAFTGTGTAFNMTFKVKSLSSASILDIVSVELSNDVGNPISKQIIDGFFFPVGAPQARFTWWPNTGVVNKPVIFNASESYDPDGGSVSKWYWNFGDGNRTATTDSIIYHSFNHTLVTKTYSVSLIVEDDTGTNSSEIEHQVTIVNSRNIKIESIVLTPRYKTLVNGTVYINITVANEGYVKENITLTAYYTTSSSSWSIIASKNIVNLDHGPNPFSIVWNTTGIEPDKYYVAKVNATTVPYEDETDNTKTSQPIYVTSKEEHDLVVEQLTLRAYHGGRTFTPPIILGEDASFIITVSNNGSVAEKNFEVILYSNTTVINQWNITETLDAGFAKTLEWRWTEIAQRGNYNITVQAIVENDTDLDNNCLQQVLKVIETPQLNITCTPETPIVNETAALNASSSLHRDLEGQITSYRWDIYEPGKTPVIDLPVAKLNGTIASYNFTKEGNWTVVLTVTDNYGLTYDTKRTLTSSYRIQMPIEVQAEAEVEKGGGIPIEYIVIPIVVIVVVLVIMLIYRRRKQTSP